MSLSVYIHLYIYIYRAYIEAYSREAYVKLCFSLLLPEARNPDVRS